MMPAAEASVNGATTEVPRITVFPTQPRGRFGESWARSDIPGQWSMADSRELAQLPAEEQATVAQERLTRAAVCVNACCGLTDPHGFMRDAKVVLPAVSQSLTGELGEIGAALQRMVAQLKQAGVK